MQQLATSNWLSSNLLGKCVHVTIHHPAPGGLSRRQLLEAGCWLLYGFSCEVIAAFSFATTSLGRGA